MVRGESKSPKRNKLNESSASSNSTRSSRTKLSESFPEVGRRIKVYKNGEPYDQGITFVLNMKKTHDIGTFLDLVTSRIGLVQGAKRLYNLDGKLIKKTDELINGKEYVASSGSFIPLPYGKKRVERESSSTSIRSTIKSRTPSTGPTSTTTSRSKSIETLSKKKPALNGSTIAGNGNIGNGSGGGTFGRSKSQVSLKGKNLPNGHAKIVTPVIVRKNVVKKSPSGIQTTSTTKKVATNVGIGKKGSEKASTALAGTKTTAATKVEKKVTKKQGKKKVKEVKEEESTVVEHGTAAGVGAIAVGGALAGAIIASEMEKSPSPISSPVKSPSPRKKTPSPKSPESPRPKTAASRPITAASKKAHESEEEEKSEKDEPDRESIHHDEEEEEEEEDEGSERHSETASESEEEEEDDINHQNDMTESEGSGRPGTAASKVSRRASLKSNKSN